MDGVGRNGPPERLASVHSCTVFTPAVRTSSATNKLLANRAVQGAAYLGGRRATGSC